MVKLLAWGKFVPPRKTEYCPEQRLVCFLLFFLFYYFCGSEGCLVTEVKVHLVLINIPILLSNTFLLLQCCLTAYTCSVLSQNV